MKKKRARIVIINVYEQQQQQQNLYFDVFVVVIIIIIGRKFLFHVFFFDLINSAIRKIGEKIVYFASFEMDQYTLKHVSSPS